MDEQETIREAMRLIGSRTSARKAAAVKENGKKGGAAAQTEEARAKMRVAQQARRAREQAEKESQATSMILAEK